MNSITFKSILTYLGIFGGFFSFRIKRSVSDLGKFGYLIEEPEREHAWIDVQQHNIYFVRVKIGPHLSFPEIQRVFRFIKKYKIKTLVSIVGDPWGHMGTKQFENSYEDWLINLFNRLQVPAEVEAIQLLDQVSSSFLDWYHSFYNKIANIDREKLHPVNRNVKFVNCALPSITCENGKLFNSTFLNTALSGDCLFISEQLKFMAYKSGKRGIFSRVANKIRWSQSLYKTIRSLFYLKELVGSKKVAFTALKINSESVMLSDVIVPYYLCKKVFSDQFVAILLNGQRVLKNKNSDTYKAIKEIKSES